MASKESKYERVEKVDVDKAGGTSVKNVGEDRGKEDPGMNFQDKRPADLVPGAQAGVISGQYIESQPTDKAALRLREHLNESERIRTKQGSVKSTSSSSSSSKTSGFVEPSLKYRGEIGPIDKTGQPIHRTGVTSQRTTVVTETTQQNAQRSVPIQPHQQRIDHEVITHDTHTRGAEQHTVTIPTTTFATTQLESVREGRTFTEDAQLTIPAPTVAPQIHSKQQFDLSGGTSATIHATTDLHLASEAQINDMGPEEYARYRAKVEDLARQHEDETSKRAAAYRSAVEADAELIRQTLERQHMRDIEFRKEMVETAVDRQQQEIRLEAEYAMRALEQERNAARSALDSAKASTNISVNIDSAIGSTHSEGRVTTTSEAQSQEQRGGSAKK